MKYIAIVCALCALWGCSSDSPSDEEWRVEVPIQLSGALSSTEESSSRTTGSITGTAPTKDYPISLLRADQPYGNTYQTKANPATLESGGTITSFPQLFYLSDRDKNSKLVGVYPAVDETFVTWTNGTTVTYTGLTGATDVLCSNTMEGSKNAPMNKEGKKMVFNHMMTQVELKVVWTTDAKPLWDNLSKVTLKNAYPNLKVTLPGLDTNAAATSEASGEPADMTFTSETGDSPEAISPTTYATTFGYLMFAPITTNNDGQKLRFKVEMSDEVTIETKEDSPLGICEAGTKYIVTLQFTAEGVKFSGVEIEPWDTETIDGPITIK